MNKEYKKRKGKGWNKKKALLFLLMFIVLFGLNSYIFDFFEPTGLVIIENISNHTEKIDFEIITENIQNNSQDLILNEEKNESNEESFNSKKEKNQNSNSIKGLGYVFPKTNQGKKEEDQKIKKEGELIKIISPKKNSGSNGTLIVEYILTRDENISNCSLLIDGQKYLENIVTIGESQNFIVENLKPKKYDYHILCEDIEGNLTLSENRKIHAIKSSNFKGLNFYFDNFNIESIPNLTLESPSLAKIHFLDSINLSGGMDINKYVDIKHNFVSINSSFLPQLNKSAIIYLYNLNFSKEPVIQRNNEICQDCEIISYDNGLLVFSVESFSSYIAGVNSQLEIWDDSDNELKDINEIHSFYANYTSIATDLPILNAECNVSIAGVGDYDLFYDSTSLLYTFNTTFNNKGTYDFNIECGELSYEALNTSDQAFVNSQWINVANSTRPDDPTASVIPTQAGNWTTMNLDEDYQTQFWTGFIGNVSGTLILASSENNKFYSWNNSNPLGEVYASRESISFENLRCANETNMADEEIMLGMSVDSDDGINETFKTPDHRKFWVVNTLISQDTCNTTNPFVNGMPQSNSFANVLLFDEQNNITVYTALMYQNQDNFKGQKSDFQMLVAEDGMNSPNTPTAYFFYVELA